MILNCPRCGFSQPEDQYCAQCGVNMQSFRPAEKTIGKKLSENITLQVLILLVAAGIAGSYMIQTGTSPVWVQKLTRSQGVSKSTKNLSTMTNSQEIVTDSSSINSADSGLNDLKNKEITIEQANAKSVSANLLNTADGEPVTARSAEIKDSSKDVSTDSSLVGFKLTYAEISVDVLAKWIAESSRLGLFQNLPEYSAGILPDYKKRGDPIHTVLKTHDKKLSLGQAETFLSGVVGDDGQMIGINAALEMKSIEAGTVHGSLIITRSARLGRENFPSEFDLTKGAAFFIVDTLTRQNFAAEKATLTMPPFQVFKSLDFMAQKTKFVIVLEPEIK